MESNQDSSCDWVHATWICLDVNYSKEWKFRSRFVFSLIVSLLSQLLPESCLKNKKPKRNNVRWRRRKSLALAEDIFIYRRGNIHAYNQSGDFCVMPVLSNMSTKENLFSAILCHSKRKSFFRSHGLTLLYRFFLCLLLCCLRRLSVNLITLWMWFWRCFRCVFMICC